MGNQDPGRERKKPVAVMGDIGKDGARLGEAVGGPGGAEFGGAGRAAHVRPRDRRTGWACSWARIQSCTAARR